LEEKTHNHSGFSNRESAIVNRQFFVQAHQARWMIAKGQAVRHNPASPVAGFRRRLTRA